MTTPLNTENVPPAGCVMACQGSRGPDSPHHAICEGFDPDPMALVSIHQEDFPNVHLPGGSITLELCARCRHISHCHRSAHDERQRA